MTTDDVVVDVSQDWVLAAMSSSGLCRGWGGPATRWTIARSAAKFEPSAAIAVSSCLLRMTAWRWSLAMYLAKVSPRHS
jgi:hypothetical protein